MTSTIPNIEPKTFRVGDTVKWKRTLSSYLPSNGWTLKYSIKGDANITEITSTQSGDSHMVELSAATTASFTAGNYWYQAYVEKGAERYTVDEGSIEIKNDLSAVSSSYDGRIHARKVLDALEATIENRATLDQQSYSINGRSLSRMTGDELISWLKFYRREVKTAQRDEDIRKGRTTGGNKVLMRF